MSVCNAPDCAMPFMIECRIHPTCHSTYSSTRKARLSVVWRSSRCFAQEGEHFTFFEKVLLGSPWADAMEPSCQRPVLYCPLRAAKDSSYFSRRQKARCHHPPQVSLSMQNHLLFHHSPFHHFALACTALVAWYWAALFSQKGKLWLHI